MVVKKGKKSPRTSKAVVEKRYRLCVPITEYNEYGFSPLYCPIDAVPDWSELVWGPWGSGGDALCRHFFREDRYFMNLLFYQKEGFYKVSPYHVLTAPDLSIEDNFPAPMVVQQIFWSSALGSSWQRMGKVVVPVLQWGSRSTLPLCLAGIQKGSVVAVRGAARGSEEAWLDAFSYLYDQLEPSLVLLFGRRQGTESFGNVVYYTLR